MDSFQIVVTEKFEVDPRYTGLTQDQLNWLLENFFWHGVSEQPGYFRLTFHLPLPPLSSEQELTE